MIADMMSLVVILYMMVALFITTLVVPAVIVAILGRAVGVW